ncbi:MAG: Fur family transcriptional regulator [Chloroflexota bacterium]
MSFQEKAVEAIRASGGRITAQRQIVLDLLAGANEDIDAEHLHNLAIQHDPGISLPTIYRTLRVLETAKLISPRYVSTDHDRKMYRVTDETIAAHFTCRNCGSVIAFRSDLIGSLKQEMMSALNVDIATLCICAGGLCEDCQEEL